MWTCPLVFCGLKSLPKKCLFFAAAILWAFFLHALSACMLLHDCRSRVASLATSDQAVRRDASRFRFPARPTPVCTSFRLSCGTSLPVCYRQSFHLHGIPEHLIFAGLHWLPCSTSRWCGRPPSCYTLPALLHLAVRCTPCQKRMRCTTIPLSRSSGPPARLVAIARRRLCRASSFLSVVCRRLF